MTTSINKAGAPVPPHCLDHKTFNAQCLACIRLVDHEPGSDLTKDQKETAKYLRSKRPMVIPGTRAIIVEAEARVWHAEVTQTILTLKLKSRQVTTFCDACGVAE